MIDPEDSLVAPPKSSPLKAVAAAVAIVGVVGAGYWMFNRGTGQPENPARVLVVGPTPSLAGFLDNEGFDVDHLARGVAIGEGQAFDSSLDGLEAMVEYADQRGFGFLALNMAHGEQYEFSSAGYEAGEPPAGTTFAVLSIGDLGKVVTYGGAVPEVAHDKPAGEQVGLMLALFGHEQLAKAKTQDADNDLMIRFGSAGTLEDLEELEKGQENMRRQIAAWTALSAGERAEAKPLEIARPYELLHGWPLANGALLLASGRDAWHSSDGKSSAWRDDELEAALSVVTLDALDQRSSCDALPETMPLEGRFALAPAGDAMLVATDRYIADLWVLAGDGCSFERRDQIRRLDGGELGQPRASGRTAASIGGGLTWADVKMRRYRELRVEGIDMRHGELHWADNETVVIPANLSFLAAADARQRRLAREAAGDEPLPELEPIDPTTVPEPREGLVFVRLPPPQRSDDIQVAVVPVDALVAGTSGAAEPATLSIRDVFLLPATPGAIVALIDAPDGSRLVRATLGDDAAIWHNVVLSSYDLGAAIELPKGALVAEVLAADLPHEAHDLAISPTGSHAAWAAPFGDAPDGRPLANFEIVLLPLGAEGAAPTRMTDNDRSDQRPRFAGKDGSMLVFDSSYTAADDLPTIESLRALPVPG